MRYLGIDQSYRSTGIVIIENDIIIHCERYVTNIDNDVYARADELATHIKSIALRFNPTKIGLEGLSFGSTGNVTRDLGGLLFTIILYLRHSGFYPKVIAPPTVKKLATGSGRAKKEQIIESLPTNVRGEFDALGVKKTTGLSDLADAYWIAKAVSEM
jgi:Holliday junction resolvasome RuvABC endonuclease subunit